MTLVHTDVQKFAAGQCTRNVMIGPWVKEYFGSCKHRSGGIVSRDLMQRLGFSLLMYF